MGEGETVAGTLPGRKNPIPESSVPLSQHLPRGRGPGMRGPTFCKLIKVKGTPEGLEAAISGDRHPEKCDQ